MRIMRIRSYPNLKSKPRNKRGFFFFVPYNAVDPVIQHPVLVNFYNIKLN